MKKTQKKIVGLFGLLLVIAMTIFAAMMPDSPKASAAIIGTSIDEFRIRVVGATPNAKFVEPTENINTSDPDQGYKIDYENLTDIAVKLTYTNEAGVPSEIILEAYNNLDFQPGSLESDFDLASYGYGKFVLGIYGIGFSGNETYLDGISFVYSPIIVSAEQNEDNGLVDAFIEMYGDDVAMVDIYLEGELLKTVPRSDFGKVVELSVGALDSGYHKLVFVAKNADGKVLGTSYEALFYYNTIYVPDTGGLFTNLNISKTDYLVTGLIIFFVFGITAFVVVIRKDKKIRKR